MLSLALTLLLPLLSSAQAPVQGLVHLRVEVFDEGTGEMAVREGSGALVQWRSRYFVLTAAHVTVGEDPLLESDGEKLSVLGRFTDATADLEWFEVKRPELAKPKAVWNPGVKDFILNPTIRPTRVDDTMTVVSDDCALVATGTAREEGTCESVFFIPPAIVPSVKSVSQPEIYLSGRDTMNRSLLIASKEPVTGRIVLPRSVQRGESGSPIFREEPRSNGETIWRLVGVAQSFDIHFPLSYYGTNLLSSFRRLVGRRIEPKFTGSFWRLRYGMTYLDFGNGIKEIALARGQAGSGGLTDDGGGAGLTDDGGAGGGGPEDDVFRARRLLPGIEVDKKACLGFHALQSGAYFADRALVSVLTKGKIPRENCVGIGDSLRKLLQNRFENIAGKKLPLEFRMKDAGGAKIWGHKDTISVRLPVFSDAGYKIGAVAFELNEKGGLGKNAFRPVIRVNGPDNKPYVVDLRWFYFSMFGAGDTVNLTDASAQPPTIQIMRADSKPGTGLIRRYIFNDAKWLFFRED